MTTPLFYTIVWIWIAIAIIIFPFLVKIIAPYGRHTSRSWGPVMNSKAGWIVMEFPSLAVFTAFFFSGPGSPALVNWIFFGIYSIHYLNRTFVFPFRLRTKEKKMPVSVVLMGVSFNLVNGFINGYYLGTVAPDYSLAWLYDPRFIVGMILFFAGFFINQWADLKLINLRKPGETGYKIPAGGLFSRISCPNHFGEIIEWTGFAVMVWSLPAFAFALWTATNLIPRAIHHHRWYQKNFEEYPQKRKAVIPFIV